MHFASSARTIDLLGRQQIAGASTALSEIFKNAHDAYAAHIRVDVRGGGELVIVRDDGLGMSPDDFEQRWLTLAASKSTERGIKIGRDAKERPVLGAKGIGRLAVAIVGRNVLIITRSKGEGATVALVPWKLFEIPGLNLDDIQVAVENIDGSSTYGDAVQNVLASTLKSTKTLRRHVVKLHSNGNGGHDSPDEDIDDPLKEALELIDSVSESVSSFDLSVLDGLLGAQEIFLGAKTGTAFVVFPVDNEDVSELAAEKNPEDHQLVRDLLGFFLPNDLAHQLPSRGSSAATLVSDMEPSFFLDDRDLVSESEFFTIDQLLSMDHQVVGSFDEDGYFKGEVSVYGSKPAEFELPWRDDEGAIVGRAPKCGRFDFWTSAIEGTAKDSALDAAEHSKLAAKLDGLGGVYVYRNGVRVLPYGRPNFDWLGIEERRTKHLARNYFSHRRMFGAIVIDGDDSKLEEKAGREGFISNQAYRDLRDILTRFFRELAAQFFVKGGEQSGGWQTTRDANRSAYQDRKQSERDLDENRRRDQFQEEVSDKYLRLDEELPDEVSRIHSEFEAALARIEAGDSSTEPAAAGAASLGKLLDAEARYQLDAPADLGLTAELERDKQVYRSKLLQVIEERVAPVREEIYSELALRVPTSDYASFVLSDLTMRANQMTDRLGIAAKVLERDLPGIQGRAQALIAEAFEVWEMQREQALKIAKADLSSESAQRISVRHQAEERLTTTAAHLTQAIDGYRVALMGVDWSREKDAFFTSADASSRIQSRVLDLEDESRRTSSLVMRGMMLANLEHEFNNVINSVRRSVDILGRRASKGDEELASAIESVQITFEHLDGFLGVMSPLRRTATTRPAKITGRQLRRFVLNVFDTERSEPGVDLVFDENFDKFEIVGHRSVWYPVLVNLIDNAIFWALRQNDSPRVEVVAAGDEISISDNGPGVSPGDVDAIWYPQFSRKPGGTGLGLSISRNAIAGEGYEIELDEKSKAGARFILRPEKATNSD